MAIKMKQKVFGPVFVTFDAQSGIKYAFEKLEDATIYPPKESPVVTLIASLGSCIVESVKWVANQRTIDLNPFVIQLSGAKATDLPGRLASIDVMISGGLVSQDDLAMDIVKQAKSICTVSNTLNCQVNIVVGEESAI